MYLVQSRYTITGFAPLESIWKFVIPFSVSGFPEKDGYSPSYASQGALATRAGLLLTGGLIWKGYEIRKWQGMPVTPRDR